MKNPGGGRGGVVWSGGSGGNHGSENVVAKVGDMLALEVHTLSFEPGNKGGDGVLLAGVTASLDAGGHGAGEGVDAGAAHDVSTESSDAEDRSGHGW